MSATATRPDTSPAGAPPSPAEEAAALLRMLLFAERRRFFDAVSEFDLHPAQGGESRFRAQFRSQVVSHL